MERAKAIVFPFLVASAEWRVATWAERSRLGLSEVEARASCYVLVLVMSKPTISIVGPNWVVLLFFLLSFRMLTVKMLTRLASPLAPLQRRGESLP